MSKWWPDHVPFQLRVFFRTAFLLLALATVALALSELREEKRLSYQGYRQLFDKNVEQLVARLAHPSGQLALLNPTLPGATLTPLRPLLLPFSAIDFDDKAKAEQAAEMAGCLVQYPNHAQLCVSVGNNPVAGGFIYAVGAFASGPLVTHEIGDLDLSAAHRLVVEVTMRGSTYQWIAPLEPEAKQRRSGFRGRLTGFAVASNGQVSGRPDQEFRGWLWQDGRCLEGLTPTTPTAPTPPTPTPPTPSVSCLKRSFFSVRLPVDLFRADLNDNSSVVWPPKDLNSIRVRVQAFAPDSHSPLFDSNSPGASAPFALADLKGQLLPGETLTIHRLMGPAPRQIIALTSQEDAPARPSPLLQDIIGRLNVEGYDHAIHARRVVTTPVGDYEVLLTGDLHSVDTSLGLVAGRLAWYVVAMLLAIVLTWVAIELRIIRRITLLTQRAATLKRSVDVAAGLQMNLRGLQGSDELGLLAGVLSELLQKINIDAKREQIRAEHEKDMWHAVGHEIMAPLQSLAALHDTQGDPSLRYIERMRQAVRVLYGSASPSEAILSANLQVKTLDVQSFLQTVANNAAHAGIAGVEFDGLGAPLVVKAEESSLEDVITHVLSNAERYRLAATPIRITLRSHADTAEVRIHNQGQPIEVGLLHRIFEYGVSDSPLGDAGAHRGQGLYVAKTYMAKMGGTVEARNVFDGVEFVLTLDKA